MDKTAEVMSDKVKTHINSVKEDNFIQDLPDNAFTKHLKNIAKGAVFDYAPNVLQRDAKKKPEQSNATTEYQAPHMSSFIAPSSAIASSPIVRRVITESPQKKNYNNNKYSKKTKGK